MSNDEREPRTENLPVRAEDGFGDESDSDRLLQGTRLICIDGEWTFSKDETEVPADKRFLVLATVEGQQHWQDGQLVEERIKKSGVPFAETVDELNNKIPKETWEEGKSGPRAPWSHQFAAYLLDPTDAAIYTAMNNTFGMMAAVRELKSKVRWMRALRGEKVSPMVTLGSRLVSKKYQKYGPDFVVVEWRDLDPGLPEQTAPRRLEDRTEKETLNDPVEDIGRLVDEPSMAEILDDKIPEDDWQPPGKPMTNAAPKAPATPPQKPAAQKPRMTKKGVQKIAGGRGR